MNYVQMGKDNPEAPVLAHFSFIALGELSKQEGLERAKNLYAKLSQRLAALENDSIEANNNKITAGLTDVYDLVRNIISNQIAKPKAKWPEVANILEKLGIKNQHLSHKVKQELKHAATSIIDLKTVEELDNFNDEIEMWLEKSGITS
jgi:hypothetical protein